MQTRNGLARGQSMDGTEQGDSTMNYRNDYHNALLEAAKGILAATKADLAEHRSQHIQNCGCFHFESYIPTFEAAIKLAEGKE